MAQGRAADVIHIACQADRRFTPDCGVMLHSLFSVNSGEQFEIHFMHHPELAGEDLGALAEIAAQFGARWSPIPVSDERMKGFPYNRHFGGYAACYRLLLPELVPDCSRMLYVDADTLHLERIRPLWETPLEGHCVAAVTNPLFDSMKPRVEQVLGVPAGSYFNSGVLLFDLERMRSSGLAAELVAFARQRRIPLPWPDQDALNGALWRHRLALHPRWNTLTGIYELPDRYMPWDAATLAETRARPALLHFVGGFKPRHYRFQHPYRQRYFDHLRQTRWRDLPIEGKTLLNRVLRTLPSIWQWRLAAMAAQLKKLGGKLRRMVAGAP